MSKKRTTRGVCRLCHVEKTLLKKSHIIPDFMYKGLFDGNHKLNQFTVSSLKTNRRLLKRSDGEYEQQILCQPCDNEIIGAYETYASQIPKNLKVEHRILKNGDVIAQFRNLDYKIYKLFLLSILWRASISSRGFFHEVQLGPYEETIRRMILQGNPGEANEFPIIIIGWPVDEWIPRDYIAQPERNRKAHGIRYVFTIAGVTYVFHVSPRSLQSDWSRFTVRPDNTAYLLCPSPLRARELFKSYLGL